MEIAYVLINCELGSEKAILESLKHIDSVTEVHGTFGAYDIITKIESQDSDKLREIITLNIRNIKHVCSTLTLMGIPDQN